MSEIEAVRELLHTSERVVVVSHERADGDAVGSLLALCLSLEKLGAEVFPILPDGLPPRFTSLPGAARIQQKPPVKPYLLITVDSSDLERLGELLGDGCQPDINFDHHPTNTHFAKWNFVDPAAVSTTEVLYDLFSDLGLAMAPAIATNLLAGLLTDTLCFRTANVNSHTLRLAAELIELGAPLRKLYMQTLVERDFVSLRYWAEGLHQLQREDGMIWTRLSLQDRERVGYSLNDDADLIDLLSAIGDAVVTLIFIEQDAQRVKVSWRAAEGYDVAGLASSFGGGGHNLAAGATIRGSLLEVEQTVLAATRAYLRQETGGNP